MKQRTRKRTAKTEIKTLPQFIGLHFQAIKKYCMAAVKNRYYYNQEAFVIDGLEKCLRKHDRYKGPLELLHVKRWCRRVVLNEAYDFTLQTMRRRELLAERITDLDMLRFIEQSPDFMLEIHDSLKHCLRIVSTMGPSHQAAFKCKLTGQTPKFSSTVYQYRKEIKRCLGAHV